MARWSSIKNKRQYREALNRIEALIDLKRTDAQQNEFMLLSYLIQEYEHEHMPLPDVSPHEVISFIMEMKGIRQKDLIPLLGTKGNVSKILSGAAQLQLDTLDTLSRFLGIPVEALVPRSVTAASNR